MRKRMNRRNGGYIGDWRLQDQAGTITPDTPTNLLNKTQEWFRPKYWLPMPEMTAGSSEEFAGLFAIYKGATGFTGISGDSNFVAMLFQGNYIVDWGITTPSRPNGLTIEYTTNTRAQYQYNWNDVPASTETPEGYRQVMIRVTPQPGQNITNINLRQIFSSPQIVLNANNMTPWLSIKICAPELTSINIGSSSPLTRMDVLREIEFVGRTRITGLTDLAQSTTGLRIFKGSEFSHISTIGNSVFTGCNLLTRVPLINTLRVTNTLTAFFQGCNNLEIIPPLYTDTSISIGTSLFGTSVVVPPVFSTRSMTTTFQNTYGSCRSLKRINAINDILDISRATNATSMFLENSSLIRLPNTIKADSLVVTSTMFSECRSLRYIPAGMCYANINTCTSMYSAMSRCTVFPTDVIGSGLTSAGLTALAVAVNNISGIVAPRLNWSKVINVSQAYNTSSFPEIVGGVMTAGWAPAFGGRGACMGWGTNSFTNNMYGLKILPKLQGLLQNTDIRGNMASPTELDAFFTDLGTTAGRLNVGGNWGVTGGGRTPPGASFGIAIAKGWTFTNV